MPKRTLKLKKPPIDKKKLNKIKKYLEDKSDIFEEKKDRYMADYYSNDVWTTTVGRRSQNFETLTLPNPFDVVVKFIQDKGLKLYGGQALHEHLKKYKNGFYKKYEFPDYDVFSPNAWEHAKELSNIFYDLGFDYTGTKGSILNDDHHQTYKVEVDMLYILDLTQSGCTPERLRKDCDACGMDKKGKCFSSFNHIPAINLKTYDPKVRNPKVFRETYDFKKDKAIHPDKMFVCDPDWLKISMYRELTEPLDNPSRLPKVGKRLELFNHYFEYDHEKCDEKDYNKEVQAELIPVLKFIGKFIKEYGLINFGASAYNMFVKNTPYDNLDFNGNQYVSDYKVYTGDKYAALVALDLKEKLDKEFKDLKFNIQEKHEIWKEMDVNSIHINVSNGKKLKFNNIFTVVQNDTCMPYIQYNKVRYVTIDRLKFLYYRAVSLPELFQRTDENPKNYECMLSNLIRLEEDFNKKIKGDTKKLERSKYRRYVGKCLGDNVGKIIPNLVKAWGNKMEVLKNTKYILDAPKKDYITKIYPMADKELKLPYKPMEVRIKAHKKYHKDLKTKYKRQSKKIKKTKKK